MKGSPADPARIYASQSSSWFGLIIQRSRNGGLCLLTIIFDPTNPQRVYMAISSAGAFRTDDAGDSWRKVSGNLPSDFGFRIGVHAHEPETIYVVPIRALPAGRQVACVPQPQWR